MEQLISCHDAIGESKISLIVVQPTTYCNIDCTYCYLKGRSQKNDLCPDTLDYFIDTLIKDKIVAKQVEVCWHAGEPLSLAPDRLEALVSRFEKLKMSGTKVVHTIQTNAIAIRRQNIDLINKWNIAVGISLDGPKSIHDRSRKLKNGRGTFDIVLKKLDLMRKHGIDPYVISVVSFDTIYSPVEYFDFFEKMKLSFVCINIDEVEGANKTGSLRVSDLAEFRGFLRTIFELSIRRKTVLFRELMQFGAMIVDSRTNSVKDSTSTPNAIVTLRHDGQISTFSPEIAETHYSDWMKTGSVRKELDSDYWRNIKDSISDGNRMCAASCDYYELCGGGCPSNKYFENGAFSTTETTYCNFMRKAVVDVILELLSDKKMRLAFVDLLKSKTKRL